MGKEYELKAMSQLVNAGVENNKTIVPKRGAIVDRNRMTMAVSSTVYNIYIDVRILAAEKDDIIRDSFEKVNRVLGTPMEELYSYIAADRVTGKLVNDVNYFVFARGVEVGTAKRLEEMKPRCVYLEEDSYRKYVHDNAAAQVIGFIRGGSAWGLEAQYNVKLTGLPGRILSYYDANGGMISDRIEAEEGYTLVTTLDLPLQQAAERLCQKYGNEYRAPNASVIVMNPNTGEILALAQYPTFNPNKPMDAGSVNSPALAEELGMLPQDELIAKFNRIWPNFNISETLEPGSVFKPITVAAAYEEGIINEGSRYYCSGSKTVNGVEINCHLTTGHGDQSLDQAISNSCNVALMEIGEKLGRDRFSKYQRDFGFGEKTGIDLPAEESAGTLIFIAAGLNPVELATCSFGQRFKCTPIQMITAFAAVINGGNLYKPYIVSQMIDAKGNVVYNNTPEITRKVISKETSDYLRVTQEQVISPAGTGWRAVIEGYAIGGKTGTAEQGIRDTAGYSHSVSFITYLPVEEPQYLVLVLINKIDDYEDGVTTAGYFTRDMLLEIIKYKAIPPTYDTGNNPIDYAEETAVVGDCIGKTAAEATRLLNGLGFDYEFFGASGNTVVNQFPPPNTKTSKGATVFLTIAPGEGSAELLTVPDVTGNMADAAVRILEDSGFGVSVVFNGEPPELPAPADGEDSPAETPDSAAYGNRTVYEQSPEAGVKIAEGTEVKIRVR